jgi:hypothetical protein
LKARVTQPRTFVFFTASDYLSRKRCARSQRRIDR